MCGKVGTGHLLGLPGVGLPCPVCRSLSDARPDGQVAHQLSTTLPEPSESVPEAFDLCPLSLGPQTAIRLWRQPCQSLPPILAEL